MMTPYDDRFVVVFIRGRVVDDEGVGGRGGWRRRHRGRTRRSRCRGDRPRRPPGRKRRGGEIEICRKLWEEEICRRILRRNQYDPLLNFSHESSRSRSRSRRWREEQSVRCPPAAGPARSPPSLSHRYVFRSCHPRFKFALLPPHSTMRVSQQL